MVAAIWTSGLRRPGASPEPIARTPPANFTATTRNGALGQFLVQDRLRHVGRRSLTPLASSGGLANPLARPGSTSNAKTKKPAKAFECAQTMTASLEPLRPIKQEQEEFSALNRNCPDE